MARKITKSSKACEKIGMKSGAAQAAPAALLQTAVLVAVLLFQCTTCEVPILQCTPLIF